MAVPAVLDFFGYHFQAGPLIVGVAGAIIARLMIPIQTGKAVTWKQEVPVMLLCVFVTALVVQDGRNLLVAGVTGLGIGGVGTGLLGFINSLVGARIRAALSVLFGVATSPAPASMPEPAAPITPRDDDIEAMNSAIDTLNKQP